MGVFLCPLAGRAALCHNSPAASHTPPAAGTSTPALAQGFVATGPGQGLVSSSPYSEFDAINDGGVIVGRDSFSSGDINAAVWNGATQDALDNPAPEPSALACLALGMLGLGGLGWKARRRA